MPKNVIQFLKNQELFGVQVRHYTAKILLKELNKAKDYNTRKLCMLRIIYELTAATEDFAMWLVAITQRNDGNKKFRDIWERLLTMSIMEQNTKQVFIGLKRARTINGVLKKLNLPNSEKLAKEADSSLAPVEKSVSSLKQAIDSSVNNFDGAKGLLVRAYNKTKHGMMVCLDSNDTHNLIIRDFSVNYSKSSKNKLIRKNRIMDLRVDIQKAEELVGTIHTLSLATQELINLLLLDYKLELSSKKNRMTKKNKAIWLSEINSSNI